MWVSGLLQISGSGKTVNKMKEDYLWAIVHGSSTAELDNFHLVILHTAQNICSPQSYYHPGLMIDGWNVLGLMIS